MGVEDYLQEGKLDQALAQLQLQVRNTPSKVELRIFLFQLLAVMGQWQRALTQLTVAGELDAGALAMVQTYREAIRCEVLRAEVFAGKRSPQLFGKPEQWEAQLIEALRLMADGHYAQAKTLRDQAFDAAPSTSGVCDGKTFDWIADADIRLGPILEAVINGQYFWVPFHHIQKIIVEEPVDLRDLVWMPAYFVWANGGESVGLIPARYPDSENSEDDALCLARKTEWQECADDTYLGYGQRMLATDTGEYPLMDIRAITLNTAGATQEENKPAEIAEVCD